MDRQGRTLWIVDAHGYGKRFIVRADEIVTAFLELEGAIHEFAEGWSCNVPRRNVRANGMLIAF